MGAGDSRVHPIEDRQGRDIVERSEARCHFRNVFRKAETNPCPAVMADDCGSLDSETDHEFAYVSCHRFLVVSARRLLRCAVAS